MNLKLVLRTYSALRQLTDDETALLETLKSLSDNDRELLVESLSPQPQKRTMKKSNKSPSKSKRAESLAEQVKKHPRPSGDDSGDGDSDNNPDTDAFDICAYQYPKNGLVNAGLGCGEYRLNAVHDPTAGYAGYHPFVEPSPAPSARGRSSSKNGSPTAVASSEADEGNVLSAMEG